MSAPAWANDLVATVCADAGVPPPRLLWRVRRGGPSTGVARRSDGTVSVRAGNDPLDQRLTLLHELAHWIAPAARRRGRRSVHHGRGFYAVAFDLYRRHGLDDADALRLESARYRSALAHAVALGIPGAAAALAEHRTRLRARPRRQWRVLVPEHASGSSEMGAGRSAPSAVSGWSGRICGGSSALGAPVRHVLMTAVA